MSFFAGRDREGKAIVHSTTDSRDIYTLQGPPIPSTMFHSSLPYIFSNNIEVQPTQYTIPMFKWWINQGDLGVQTGLNGWTWGKYIPIRRSAMLVILPQEMIYAIANNKVYLVSVTNKTTGRTYLIQDNLDYICGGQAMDDTTSGGYTPLSTEIGDFGGIRIHWLDKVQGQTLAILNPITPTPLDGNAPTEVIPRFTGGNPRQVASLPDNSHTLVPAEDCGSALKAGTTEGLLLIDEGYGDNNANNWIVTFHILSIKLSGNTFINEAVNTTGKEIIMSGKYLKVGTDNILDKSILRVGNSNINSYNLNSYKYAGMKESALSPYERCGPGDKFSTSVLDSLFTRYNRHSTRANDGTIIGEEASSSAGLSRFSIWKGNCTELVFDSKSINMMKDGNIAPFFNLSTTPLYKIGPSKVASLQPPASVVIYTVPANTSRKIWHNVINGPIMNIGEDFEHLIYYTKMQNNATDMIYNKPWAGIMSYEAMNVRNPSWTERGRAYGLTSLSTIGDKKLISTVTMHDLGYTAIAYNMGVIIKYSFYIEKISNYEVQLKCEVLAIGHNNFTSTYTSDSNQSVCRPIDIVLAKIY